MNRAACGIKNYVIAVKLICSFINSLYNISCENEKYKGQSLKGFYQMLKLVAICIGAIIIISTLLDKNPVAILTGLGAGTAVLMLVFQDTIKGLVAGIEGNVDVNRLLAPKTAYEVAMEVLQGLWGNGATRKNKLESAGYNYREVQDVVNDLIRGQING